MKNDNKKLWLIVGVVGLLVPVWLAVLIAPTLGGGLPVMIPKMGDAFSHPFRFTWCDVTLPCIVVFTAMAIFYRKKIAPCKEVVECIGSYFYFYRR